MDKLPPRISALIQAARSAHNPTPEDQERVHAALAAAIAGHSIPPTAPTRAAKGRANTGGDGFLPTVNDSKLATGPSSSNTVSLGIGPKLLAAIALVGAAGGWFAYRHWYPTFDRKGVIPPRAVAGGKSNQSGDQGPLIGRGRETISFALGGEDNESHASRTEPSPRKAGQPYHHIDKPAIKKSLETESASRLSSSKASASKGRVSKRTETYTSQPLPYVGEPQVEGSSLEANRPSVLTNLAGEPKASEPAKSGETTNPGEQKLSEQQPSAAPDSTAREELMLIRAASQALRDKQPERALSILGQHAWLFPQGKLQEERRALRILALCEIGRVPLALTELDLFLKETPNSPYTERIQAACAKYRYGTPGK